MPLSNEQLDALVSEYEAAQAEGDNESMTAIRDALAKDRAESQSLGGRIASNAKAATEGFLPGLARIPRALTEGVTAAGLATAKYGASMADELGQLWTGRPTTYPLRESVEGLQTGVMGDIENKRMADEVVNPNSVAVGDTASGFVPLPFGKVKGARTLAQAVRRGAVEGAVAANLPFQTDDERAFSTAVGALLPGAMQAVGSFRGVVQNQLVRYLKKRMDPATNRMLAETRAAFTDPNTGQAMGGLDDYMIAQVAGDPRLSRMASQAADTRARDVTRDQFDQRIKNVKSVLDNMNAKPMDDETRAEAIFQIVKQEHVNLRNVATSEYGDSMARLRASPEGQELRVPTKPIMDTITGIEQDMGDVLGKISQSTQGGQLAQAIKDLKTLQAGNVSALKLDGLEKLQKSLNAGRTYGLAALQPEERAANEVRRRLQQAIQQTVEAGPDTAGYRSLRAIQQQYASRADVIRRFEADQLVKLFGDKEVLANADVAFDKFTQLSPAQQKEGVRLLGASSPEHLEYFRKRYLESVLDKATAKPKAAMQSTLDPEALYEGLTSDKLLKNPLFTPQEKVWARAAAKDIRVILNSNPDVTKPGTDLPLADFAINVVSRTPAFMARLATRVLTGLQLENILFTQEGRKALSTTANLRTATQKNINMATGYFLGLLNQEPTQPAEPEQQQ